MLLTAGAGFREKPLFVLPDSIFCCPDVRSTPSGGDVSFRAITITKDGAITHLKGDVEIAVGRDFILRSEQADFDSKTGDRGARKRENNAARESNR